MKRDLEVIADVLGPRPNRIVVRGHATREPVPSNVKLPPGFNDPWTLSYARARAAAAHLAAHGIAESRIQISAAGDSEPRIVSRNKEMQRENRRVDVFVIDAYITP